MMDVQSFDCQNPVMTQDLRKTLKTKVFPRLIIRFTNLNRHPDNDPEPVKGALTIQLAGVTRRLDIVYRFIPGENNSFTLVGAKQVKFSDFNLVPPQKIGGMIQPKDELEVQFHLKVKVLD
jgi:hypothetical protein